VANKQKEQEFVTKTLNGASEQFKPILEQRQQPTYQATPESEANYKTTVTSYYKPVIQMARNAQAKGLAVPPPEFFESQMNNLLNAPHGGQIQQTTLDNKKTS
jgi:membrane-bound lytic murein transglycosylase